jgi:hypothetical protein
MERSVVPIIGKTVRFDVDSVHRLTYRAVGKQK